MPAAPLSARLRAIAALALAVPGLAASAASDELLVGAATSLRDPLEACASEFEAAHPGLRLRISYGASDVLATQARAGAPLDVLLSADAEITASEKDPYVKSSP